MPRPGATITTSAAAAAASPGARLGTLFLAAQTERGPLLNPQASPIASLGDYAQVYGTRNTTLGSVSTTYDWLEAYWRSGGGPVNIARVVGPAAAVASKTLQDRAGTPLNTLKVDSKGPGTWGNTNLTISVANGTQTNAYTITILVGGVAAEISPDLFTPADAVTWSATSNYVTISDLGSATAAPNNRPAVVTAQAFSGGADDLASITDVHWTNALNTFPSAWGPGLVAKCGMTTASGHAGTLVHAAAYNRFAILDGASGASQATLTTLATTVATAATAPEYGAVFGPWITVPPFAGGPSNRLVPATAIAGGVISRQVRTGIAAQAAAGGNGVANWALDATAFTDAERDILNGYYAVNVLRKPYSASLTPPIEVYGVNTLAAPTNGWRQIPAQLLRLRITDECLLTAEDFIFDLVDGKQLKLAEFKAALVGILQGHFDNNEFFGNTPAEAYSVDVTSVNTASSLAAGQLNARIGIRVSPTPEFVSIDVVKFPITQSLVS